MSTGRDIAARKPPRAAKRGFRGLLADVRGLIMHARASVARTVDAGLALHYWQVGRWIRQDILRERRAEYEKEIVVLLVRQLERDFGRGHSRTNLFNRVRFMEYTAVRY